MGAPESAQKNEELRMPKVAEMNPDGPAAEWFKGLSRESVRNLVYGYTYEDYVNKQELAPPVDAETRAARSSLIDVSTALVDIAGKADFDVNSISEDVIDQIKGLMKGIVDFFAASKISKYQISADYLKDLLARLAYFDDTKFISFMASINNADNQGECVVNTETDRAA